MTFSKEQKEQVTRQLQSHDNGSRWSRRKAKKYVKRLIFFLPFVTAVTSYGAVQILHNLKRLEYGMFVIFDRKLFQIQQRRFS